MTRPRSAPATPRRLRDLARLAALVAALLAVAACAPASLGEAADSGERPRATTDPAPPAAGEGRAGAAAAAGWDEVDRLVDEQKLAAALEIADVLLARAREAGDAEDWTRALVRGTQLRIALHGHEKAVRFLTDTPWPEGADSRRVLDLFYGEALANYLRGYQWQIATRQRVDAGERVDLELWTAEQILAEAQEAWLRVWRQRESWGAEPLGALAEYVEANTYPAGIRSTLRDAVTYLWVGLLADSSLWPVRARVEAWKLDLPALIAGDAESAGAVDLADPEVHPLEKIGALLADLEAWHRAAGRPEAAFEARLERLRRLRDHFHRADERHAVRSELERALERLGRRFPWWSVGRAELAEMVRAEEAGDSLARAREIARAGAIAHPDSVGGRRCRRLVAEIEAPAFTLSSMESDGPGRRSILVEHGNLPALHFRAFRLDLERALAESRDFYPLPGGSEVEAILGERPPDAAWRVELPPTPDFRSHRTYVTPPLERPGLYLVAASVRADFADRVNRRSAVNLVVGDLILLTQWETPRPGSIEVTARSGASGRALPGVTLELWRRGFQDGHRRVASAVTGADGTATFRRGRERRGAYFVIGRAGDEIAVETTSIGFHGGDEPPETRVELIYTDRSVYRPLQTVRWKVVAYEGERGGDDYRTRPGAKLAVELVDPNGEVVASRSAAANDFGSVAGEFEIPSGRLLGHWMIRADGRSTAAIRVEEYKRPTFEVEVRDPAAELRLNRPAEVEGEARYYFGLPVAAGEAEWRVVREPLWLPWWAAWSRRGPAGEVVTVAQGRATLDEKGVFRVRFTPEADEGDAEEGIGSYRFRLSVDVTDRGGETRSGERSFRIGFAAVEASIRDRPGFLPAGEAIALEVARTDLEGVGRAGRGEWRLYRLEQPPEPLLPAELPEEEAAGGPGTRGAEAYRTPGDRLRPRWSRGEPAPAIVGRWPDGPEIARGEIRHDAKGRGEIPLPALEPGAYRLRYSTLDPWGSVFELSEDLLATGVRRPPLALAAALVAERASVPVGGTARFLVHSGLEDSVLVFEVFRARRRVERRVLEAGRDAGVIELPVGPEHRGGFSVRLTSLRDHQLMTYEESVTVPWDDRRLEVRFASFRDRMRPGGRETWTVEVSSADPMTLAAGSVELLAYMYDRSLDLFALHGPPDPLDLYPLRTGAAYEETTLGAQGEVWGRQRDFARLPEAPELRGDRLRLFDGYGIGGPGLRGEMRRLALEPGVVTVTSEAPLLATEDVGGMGGDPEQLNQWVSAAPVEPRADFAETAFWEPHLRLDGEGTASFSFTVPDSVTEWSAWAHALTTDLAGGSAQVRARSVKELMVRPYLPRFLREGDRAEVRVAIDNAGEVDLAGRVRFELVDPESGGSRLEAFGLAPEGAERPFSVPAGGGTEVRFPLRAPLGVGEVAVRVTARAGDLSDGELRPLPLLPGRVHLVRSRFAALSGAERRVLAFPELAAADDPSLRLERLAVTLDGQLFAGVLGALPYLVDFPYECTEQTFNRFLSTGIVSTLYERYPAVERLARELSARETRLEAWDRADPNRRLALEETPWLVAARGGGEEGDLVRVLDSRVAAAERAAALAQLERAQTSLGGFPWWPGGPPSPYMTLYLLQGFSRALEFGVEVPRGMVERAWGYLHRHYVDELARRLTEGECCVEIVTFLNYVLSSYPDPSWTGGVFDADDRRRMLDVSFRHWRRHPPLVKAQLALTLARAGRADDAKLVFDSVMDSARTTPDLGTFWAPEERAWLWYNDTIETHAFALRTLAELAPEDPRRHGLVQWLFLNKKLNQWKSTRATAEVVYALVHYLDREERLLVPEEATVKLGGRARRFAFPPGSPAPETAHGEPLGDPAAEGEAPGAAAEEPGRPNQWVLEGGGPSPAALSEVAVEAKTRGPIFASATWHFSTEEPPREGAGDLFAVERSFFRRYHDGREWALAPLADGARLEVGDEVEVRLSITSRHAAEYVHLRDPRGAGLEPVETRSGYRWDLGVTRYEEVRDSGANFFFEWLPAGEVTLVHRLRAAVAGAFKVGPATLQSMYAPEFAAYSAGATLEIAPGG